MQNKAILATRSILKDIVLSKYMPTFSLRCNMNVNTDTNDTNTVAVIATAVNNRNCFFKRLWLMLKPNRNSWKSSEFDHYTNNRYRPPDTIERTHLLIEFQIDHVNVAQRQPIVKIQCDRTDWDETIDDSRRSRE